MANYLLAKVFFEALKKKQFCQSTQLFIAATSHKSPLNLHFYAKTQPSHFSLDWFRANIIYLSCFSNECDIFCMNILKGLAVRPFRREPKELSSTFKQRCQIFLVTTYCGNNGQGDQVDNLYSKRVKSILTGHKQKHLHLYQINGRSRLGSNSGSDPSTNKNIKQFYVKQKIESSTKRREK
jgi:hypothetical protein